MKKKIKKMSKKIVVASLLLILIILGPVFGVYAKERDDGYYTVFDEKNNDKIFTTARNIYVGDKYLNEENNLFKIVKVKGDKGYARLEKKVDLNQAFDDLKVETNLKDIKEVIEVSKPKGKRLIAIYHTHGDESYIPTDGKSSIPYRGGIFKVGSSLKRSFRKRGIYSIQSYRSHDPHDVMAYQRSRRTAIELLKKGPDVLLDVHRDAVPAEEYQGNINGKPLAKVRLVVGRQNPQKKAINNFAWQIKAIADKKYPGLIKGIFYGKGGYNQDIFPRTILVEAGTYTNSRSHAEIGANLLADVIATTVYGENYNKKVVTPTDRISSNKTKIPGENKGAYRGIMWMVGLFFVGIVAFIVISTGGIKELTSKTKKFMGSEFTNFLGKNDKGDKEDNKTREE